MRVTNFVVNKNPLNALRGATRENKGNVKARGSRKGGKSQEQGTWFRLKQVLSGAAGRGQHLSDVTQPGVAHGEDLGLRSLHEPGILESLPLL